MLKCILEFLYVIVLRAPINNSKRKSSFSLDNRQLFASEGATLSGINQLRLFLFFFNRWYFGETYSRKIFSATQYEPGIPPRCTQKANDAVFTVPTEFGQISTI